ncbi:MAG: SURF1 family cytochrome oxidase biogenesis protein [Cryobacterium sp.]
MMVRTRWVLALLLALAIAAAFAVLGHWQLERAIESGVVVERQTELVMPLTDIVQPDGPVAQIATGQRVSSTGFYVPGDDEVISERFNGGVLGYWVVSHFVTADGSSIAVARGWTEDKATALNATDTASREAAASSAAAALGLEAPLGTAPETLTGRFLPGEPPIAPDEEGDPYEMRTVAPAALVNLWDGFTDQSVYFGYIVDAEALSGLDVIDSPVPVVEKELNWLNIFYAVEWAVFAGFAVYLWYRLVRDAYEREQEDLEEAAEKEAAEKQAAAKDAADTHAEKTTDDASRHLAGRDVRAPR